MLSADDKFPAHVMWCKWQLYSHRQWRRAHTAGRTHPGLPSTAHIFSVARSRCRVISCCLPAASPVFAQKISCQEARLLLLTSLCPSLPLSHRDRTGAMMLSPADDPCLFPAASTTSLGAASHWALWQGGDDRCWGVCVWLVLPCQRGQFHYQKWLKNLLQETRETVCIKWKLTVPNKILLKSASLHPALSLS